MNRRERRTTSPGWISRRRGRGDRLVTFDLAFRPHVGCRRRRAFEPRARRFPAVPEGSSPEPRPGVMKKPQFVTPVRTQNAFSRTSIESARRIATMSASFLGNPRPVESDP